MVEICIIQYSQFLEYNDIICIEGRIINRGLEGLCWNEITDRKKLSKPKQDNKISTNN